MRNILITLAAAAAIAACTPTSPTYVQPQEQTMAVINVSASADVKIAPDQAMVSAGVVSQSADAGQAMRDNAAKMTKVFEALDAAGIPRENVQTSQISLQPRYNYEERKAPRITGYEARNIITVTTDDLAKTGAMVDALVKAGINNIDQVQMTVKNPEEAENTARTNAIAKAKAKAQSMAEAAGVELGKLTNLSESSGGGRPVMYRQTAAMDVMESTPVAPGEQTISVTVNLSYGIVE
ncbi:SIMPL domain-containing protein [Robiginitomaculum antarcticum]|uniref:SIMPL domain-containing protein n=1 Tax=Robiginitomaculum antarcticum TaxID=437507 RepID=UPI0003816703|nr:SIMPL domain-containing protein [Robiginitomaculum antarcticum]